MNAKICFFPRKERLTISVLSFIALFGSTLSLGSPLIDAEKDCFLDRADCSLFEVMLSFLALDAAIDCEDVVVLIGSIIYANHQK